MLENVGISAYNIKLKVRQLKMTIKQKLKDLEDINIIINELKGLDMEHLAIKDR